MNEEIKALQDLDSAIRETNEAILKLRKIDQSYVVNVYCNLDPGSCDKSPVSVAVRKKVY